MKRLVAIVCIFAAVVAKTNAAERAWYGFHIKAETSGFVLNPIVQSVTIDMIAPNSPAERQHIHVGDEIIEAEGQTIRGTRALQLVGVLHKQPGDTLRMVLRRANGETYRVEIIGIKKPTS